MSKHIACLSVAAALAASVLPAAAADFYDGGDRPLAFHSRDDVYVEDGRARVEHGRDLPPAYGFRGGPGPVAFDERGYGGPGYDDGEPRYRRPVAIGRPAYGDDRPAAFGYGDGYGPAPLYRPAVVPVGPDFGGSGGPDVGCTIERVQSTTPLGWRKIVTHRTCYRR